MPDQQHDQKVPVSPAPICRLSSGLQEGCQNLRRRCPPTRIPLRRPRIRDCRPPPHDTMHHEQAILNHAILNHAIMWSDNFSISSRASLRRLLTALGSFGAPERCGLPETAWRGRAGGLCVVALLDVLAHQQDRYVAAIGTKRRFWVYAGFGDAFQLDLDGVAASWGEPAGAQRCAAVAVDALWTGCFCCFSSVRLFCGETDKWTARQIYHALRADDCWSVSSSI
ncbi:hypothetical protein BKA80DRAFT_298267 [Phyllosticta citrichinensis]